MADEACLRSNPGMHSFADVQETRAGQPIKCNDRSTARSAASGRRSMRRLKFPAWIVIAVALCCTASVFASVFSYQRPPAELELSNRVAADSLSGRRGSLRLYRIAVPANASDLQFTVYGSAPA